MSDLSPMMRRVLRGKKFSGSRVPKKGRIRTILILIAVAVAGWFTVSGLSYNDSNAPVKNTEVKKDKMGNSEKSQKSDIPFTAHKASVWEKKSNTEFVYPELGGVLNESSTVFDRPIDTINRGKQTFLVHYSIDTTLQKLGQALMRRYKPHYGAIVAMCPVSGRILSLISWEHDSVSSLGGQLFRKSLFPAASIFKTITAAAAIEMAGFTSESMIQHTGRNHTLYKYQLEPELKSYRDVSLEDAYVNSINPVFGRIGMYVLRKGALIEFGKRFGFETDIPFELPVEKSVIQPPDSSFSIAELASGFNQKTTLSPLLGALIASAISEKGKIPQPHLVDSIIAADSAVYRAESKLWRGVLNSRTAEAMKRLMKGVSRYGTARKSFTTIKKSSRFDDIEYGGKTGSVDKDGAGRVDWFIGFACHPEDQRQRIAVGVVTVHGPYWTVHSSYIAAEYFRVYLREIQLADEQRDKEMASESSTMKSLN